jgi:hypothetical protein
MIAKLRVVGRWAVALAITALLGACSNGASGGGGGISGTGVKIVAIGKVTGFGSVIVDGIEFTPSAQAGLPENRIRFAFDNFSTSREDSLRLGMIVTVRGSLDVATGTGEYEEIEFRPELRGPLDDGSVDTAAGTFRVLGRSVLVETATIFENVQDLDELQALQVQRPELEVSANLDETGLLHATRIARVSPQASTNVVELKGAISSVSSGGFAIGNVTVSTDGARLVDLAASDLAPGLLVDVKGTLAGATIGNARIERVAPVAAAGADDRVRLKGVARSVVSGGSFSVAGPNGLVTVHVDSQTGYFRGSLAGDSSVVSVGTEVQIEGTLRNDGSLAATVVAAESEKNVRLEGNLLSRANDVNLAAGTIVLNGVTVRTVATTRFKDNRKTGQLAVLTLADLADGDHLQIDGFVDGAGAVIAAQVQRFDASQTIFIQGPVARITASDLTILGITVKATGETSCRKGTTTYPDFAAFALQVTPDASVVKAKGTFVPPTLLDPTTELEIQP